MATMYCALCARPVEARRQMGPGTIFFAVVTAGVSLLAFPFYRKRCSICRSAAVSATAPGGVRVAESRAPYVRISELEQRLGRTEAELEAANTQMDRLRTERDFYRQLLEDPAARARRTSPPDPQ